ncbi:MAG: hypothetical protein ACKOCN_04550, partial [Planctomycetaceae bacterium]
MRLKSHFKSSSLPVVALLIAWTLVPPCGRLWIKADDAAVVPPSLESWRPWVLHGQPSVSCPSPYDSGTERIRVW